MEDNAAGHAKMEDIVKKRLQEPESKLVLLRKFKIEKLKFSK